MVKSMAMSKKLSTKTFLISQFLILIFGIAFIFGLNYLMNPFTKVAKTTTLSGGPVTSTPASLTLEITAPDDELLVFNSNLIINGKTLPKLNVLISSATEDLVVESKSDGSFTADLTLALGVNEISIVVFDEKGSIREIKRTIFYSKEKI